jgi:transcriptional regulator with XRE-family HTH domain
MQSVSIDKDKAKDIMDKNGLSVVEVARRMNVSRVTVYNLLKGKHTSLELLTSFCVALDNTNPLDILKTEGFPDPLVDASAGMAA